MPEVLSPPNKRENLLKVISKFHLRKKYSITSDYQTDVEKAYLDNLEIKKDSQSGLVKIKFEDTDPILARDIVNYNLNLISDISNIAIKSENQRKKQFVEKRFAETKLAAERAENLIRKFEEDYNILDLGRQAEATIELAANIQSKLLAYQAELQIVYRILMRIILT